MMHFRGGYTDVDTFVLLYPQEKLDGTIPYYTQVDIAFYKSIVFIHIGKGRYQKGRYVKHVLSYLCCSLSIFPFDRLWLTIGEQCFDELHLLKHVDVPPRRIESQNGVPGYETIDVALDRYNTILRKSPLPGK